jgi:predicted nucleotidyltransferase
MNNLNQEKLDNLTREYELNFLALFGSRAVGSSRENSDFDIAYSGKRRLSYSEETFLVEKLAHLLGVSPDKIDPVNMADAGPLLAKQVAQEGKVLSEPKENSFDLFQMFAFSRYFDSKFLLDLQEENLKKRVK